MAAHPGVTKAIHKISERPKVNLQHRASPFLLPDSRIKLRTYDVRAYHCTSHERRAGSRGDDVKYVGSFLASVKPDMHAGNKCRLVGTDLHEVTK